MDVPQSLVLGAIQGLTEFIPISSTAHLILAPHVLPIEAPREEIAHTYDTIIQIGTVIPVLIYFRREWAQYLRALLRWVLGRGEADDPDIKMVQFLLLGSIPAVIAGLAFNDAVESLADPNNRYALLCIGVMMIVVGVLMWLAELLGRRVRTLERAGRLDALLIGLAQAIALIPGTSRSGATITAGLALGFQREAAARFSFLLMTPIMLAATGYKMAKLILEPGGRMNSGEWTGLALATVIAALTGYAAIVFLLGWLRTRSMGVFCLYRFIVGAFCLGLFFVQAPPGARRTPDAAPAPVQSTNWRSGAAFRTPASTPRARKSRSASRPRSPMSTVQSLTYIPTKRSARPRSRPRANSIA